MSQWTDRWDLQQATLGNLIWSAHQKRRFLSCITVAERGYGKSMYHLQTMAYLYYHMVERNETEAWNFALKNMLFLPSQLEQRIDYNEEHDCCDIVWCLDDAAVHFSNKLWWTDQSEAILLEGTFDLIRPVVSGLLINCPNKKRLMSSLQAYDDYEATIYITNGGQYDRKVVCIKWYRLPDGTRRWRKIYEDTFSCYVPKWVYDEYRKIRKNYIKIIRTKLKERRDQYVENKHTT